MIYRLYHNVAWRNVAFEMSRKTEIWARTTISPSYFFHKCGPLTLIVTIAVDMRAKLNRSMRVSGRRWRRIVWNVEFARSKEIIYQDIIITPRGDKHNLYYVYANHLVIYAAIPNSTLLSYMRGRHADVSRYEVDGVGAGSWLTSGRRP